jgi:hypothetical protein
LESNYHPVYMRKFLLFVLFILIGVSSVNAQSYRWAKSMGWISADYGASVVTDDSGNVYTTGRFGQTVDFDPGIGVYDLVASGFSSDAYVQKLDANGDFVWAISIGGGGSDEAYSITIDTSGYIYTLGSFNGTVDFDPGVGVSNLIAVGNNDIFIQKLDANGNFLWAINNGDSDDIYANAITADISGNLFVTGSFAGTVDFDHGPGVSNLIASGLDAFVLKLDTNGDFMWAIDVGDSDNEEGLSIVTDANGNAYATGYFEGTTDFDPGIGINDLTSNGNKDIFIQKLDANGNFVWAKSVGGTEFDYVHSIAIDTLGNIYTTGNFQNNVDFDPSPSSSDFLSSNGSSDAFIQKLDMNGNYIWAKSMGGSSGDSGVSIAVDNSGNVYTTGRFGGTADFDPGSGTNNITATGQYLDIFVQKLNVAGNFGWAIGIGGSGNDVGQSITVDNNENVYAVGDFRDTADFNPGVGINNLISNGGVDVFVLKLASCTPSSGTDVVTTCNSSYTWIDGNNYSTDTSNVVFNFINGAASGCDSLAILDLLLVDVDTSVTTNVPGITSNASGATYQWLDCDNNYSIILGETAQTFIATANGNYAVEITVNSCIDTSACISISNIDIAEELFLNQINIYPNPNKGSINIELGNLSDISIKISNVNGKLIYEKDNINTSLYRFEFNQVPGVYIVEISNQKNSKHYKLVKH